MSQLIFHDKHRVAHWVANKVEQEASWGSFYAMGIESGGVLVAGIVFNNMNGSNATVHVAVTKANKLLPKLIEHGCNYAFCQCGLRRLTGLVEADNKKALAFDRHLGFEEEFVMKQAGSQGQDMVVLVMWRDSCRWIKGTVQ